MPDVREMVLVNCAAMVNMSASVLPLFRHRRRGAVVNVSSGSARQPTPLLATYAATKAFGIHFSKSCAREYKPVIAVVSEFDISICTRRAQQCVAVE